MVFLASFMESPVRTTSHLHLSCLLHLRSVLIISWVFLICSGKARNGSLPAACRHPQASCLITSVTKVMPEGGVIWHSTIFKRGSDVLNANVVKSIYIHGWLWLLVIYTSSSCKKWGPHPSSSKHNNQDTSVPEHHLYPWEPLHNIHWPVLSVFKHGVSDIPLSTLWHKSEKINLSLFPSPSHSHTSKQEKGTRGAQLFDGGP